jgi:hippurate hydrolase
VREHLLSAIARVVKAEAAAAGAPKEPLIERTGGTDALVNDSALTRRVSAVMIREFGAARAKDTAPEMASEDFSQFQLAGIPTLMLRVGAVPQAKYDAAMKSGAQLPSLHSSQFAPDREPTIKTAIIAEVLALRELMPASRAQQR